MKAVIMAGGSGRRLRPLTSTLPKPLAKILGKPVLSYILDLLSQNGVTQAVVTLGYLPEKMEAFLQELSLPALQTSRTVEVRPLGTAGSVRAAACGFGEDFIVISGDCVCDYDLRDAVKFHRESGAAVTILTAEVDDPREYGLVHTDAAGYVTGFCEKPDWSNITVSRANTGLYILRPEVLRFIPEDRPYDFSGDLFPKLLAAGVPICAYRAEGYWCDIGDLTAYRRCQEDMLAGKTALPLRGICEGVYAREKLPQGKYSLTPPVYIGENTEIADGASIGPFAVIGDDCFIGEGARLSHCVVLDSAAVFSGASMREAILCENAVLEENAKMFENSVLGAGACAGRNARIGKNVAVWPGLTVENGTELRANLRHGGCRHPVFGDNGLEGTLFGALSPERCALLGQALASSLAGRRIGLATDGKNTSKAAAYAFTGGAAAVGAHIFTFGDSFLSELHFFTAFCSLPSGVFISERHGRLRVRICGEGGLPLSRAAERDIAQRIESGEFSRSSPKALRGVSDMSGVDSMYRRELLRQAACMLNGQAVRLCCPNEKITLLLEDCLSTLGCRIGDEFSLKVGGSGSTLAAFHRDCGWVPMDKLLVVCCLEEFQNEHDVAVPFDAPQILDTAAEARGRRVLRYLHTPPDASDNEARSLAVKQFFTRDGLFMALKLLGILQRRGCTLPRLLSELPPFFVRRRSVDISFLPSRLKEAVGSEHLFAAAQGVVYKTPRGRVLITPSKTGRRLRLAAEAASLEVSRDLCAEVEEKIRSSPLQGGLVCGGAPQT